MDQAKPSDIAIGITMISGVVGMIALFICYVVYLLRWAGATFNLMNEVSKVSPEMYNYVRSFSSYGQKPRFYSSNPSRVSDFVKGDKLNEFPAVLQAKQRLRKSGNSFGTAIGAILLALFGGAIVIGVAVTLLDGK